MCYLEELSPNPTEQTAVASVPRTEQQRVQWHSNLSICTFVSPSRAEAMSSLTQRP